MPCGTCSCTSVVHASNRLVEMNKGTAILSATIGVDEQRIGSVPLGRLARQRVGSIKLMLWRVHAGTAMGEADEG